MASDFSIIAASQVEFKSLDAIQNEDQSNNNKFKIQIHNLNTNFLDFETEFHEKLLSQHKEQWYFYILKIIELLKAKFPENVSNISKILLVFNNNLPPAGGMSSSHALILSTLHSLSNSCKITKYSQILNDIDSASAEEIQEILIFCQEVEHAKGFKSGLGDQAALLLAKKYKFCFIKIYPELQYSYIDSPENLAFLILPSLIKAEKSSKEYQNSVKYFEKYNELNDFWFQELTANDSSAFFLGDLLYSHSSADLLIRINEIEDEKIRNLSLYALAEGARLKELKENFSENKLYSHINLSHSAEIIDTKYYSRQEELELESDLSTHVGAYRSSTAVNDAIAMKAMKIDGIKACSIMGAGLGGNNIALVDFSKINQIIEDLINMYNKSSILPNINEKQLLINTSSNGLEQII